MRVGSLMTQPIHPSVLIPPGQNLGAIGDRIGPG